MMKKNSTLCINSITKLILTKDGIFIKDKLFNIRRVSPRTILLYKDKKIKLSSLYKEYKYLLKDYICKYEEVHNEESPDVSLEISNGRKCTAWSQFNYENGILKKKPLFIEMNFNTISDLNNFKFILAHEFAHFFEYKNVKFSLKEQFIFGLPFFVSLFKIAFFLYLISLSGSNLFNIILSLFFANEFCLAPLLYGMSYKEEIWRSHQEEYLCDSYAYKMYPRITLNDTFLVKSKEGVSFSHPSSRNRLLNLKKNKKRYSHNLIRSGFRADERYLSSARIFEIVINFMNSYEQKILSLVKSKI